MTDERDLSEAVCAVVKEGMQGRRDGSPAPYPPYSVKNALYITGWVQEDLRQALMKVDPVYRAGQERFEV